MRTISSGQTFLTKVVLPTGWVGGLGAIALSAWLGLIRAKNGTPLSPQVVRLFLACWIGSVPLVLWACGRLKRVRMDASHLYISNFRKEIAVPFNNVTRVSESIVTGVYPVTVYFHAPTPFGRKITFLAPFRLSGWTSHPVSEEIRTLAGISER